jgi:hypothetical protein
VEFFYMTKALLHKERMTFSAEKQICKLVLLA